jgi:hypothetical protein
MVSANGRAAAPKTVQLGDAEIGRERADLAGDHGAPRQVIFQPSGFLGPQAAFQQRCRFLWTRGAGRFKP